MKIEKQSKIFVGKTFNYFNTFTYKIESMNNIMKCYHTINLSTGSKAIFYIKDFEESLSAGTIKIL